MKENYANSTPCASLICFSFEPVELIQTLTYSSQSFSLDWQTLRHNRFSDVSKLSTRPTSIMHSSCNKNFRNIRWWFVPWRGKTTSAKQQNWWEIRQKLYSKLCCNYCRFSKVPSDFDSILTIQMPSYLCFVSKISKFLWFTLKEKLSQILQRLIETQKLILPFQLWKINWIKSNLDRDLITLFSLKVWRNK